MGRFLPRLNPKQRGNYMLEKDRINGQANLDTDLYSVGWFDGLINSEPTQLEKQSYWSGYSLGQREYWAKKLKVEILTEF